MSTTKPDRTGWWWAKPKRGPARPLFVAWVGEGPSGQREMMATDRPMLGSGEDGWWPLDDFGWGARLPGPEDAPATPPSDLPWVALSELRDGAVFVTHEGVHAVKTEYHLDNHNPQPLCVLLASGEYAHFPGGAAELVQEIDTEALERDLVATRANVAALVEQLGEAERWKGEQQQFLIAATVMLTEMVTPPVEGGGLLDMLANAKRRIEGLLLENERAANLVHELQREAGAAQPVVEPRDAEVPPGWERYTFVDEDGVRRDAANLRRRQQVATPEEARRMWAEEHSDSALRGWALAVDDAHIRYYNEAQDLRRKLAEPADQPVVEPRDETKPPPGWRHPWSHYGGTTEQPKPGLILGKAERSQYVDLAEAWRIYDREAGYAPHPSGTEGPPTELRTYANAAENALNLIAKACGFAREWDYPLQVVRDVEDRMRELAGLRAASPPDGTAPERALRERLLDELVSEDDEDDACCSTCCMKPGSSEDCAYCGIYRIVTNDPTRPPDGMPGEPAEKCVHGWVGGCQDCENATGDYAAAPPTVPGEPPRFGLRPVKGFGLAITVDGKDVAAFDDYDALAEEFARLVRAAPPTSPLADQAVPGEPPRDSEWSRSTPEDFVAWMQSWADRLHPLEDKLTYEGAIASHLQRICDDVRRGVVPWYRHVQINGTAPPTPPLTPERAPLDEAAAVEKVLHWVMDDIDTLRLRLANRSAKLGVLAGGEVDRELFDLHMRCCKHIDALPRHSEGAGTE